MLDFEGLAKKLAKTMDKETTYKVSNMSKMLAKAGEAALHSKDNAEIAEILKDMGYKIEENYIKSFESFVNESVANVPSRDEMIEKLNKRFPNIWTKKSEDFYNDPKKNRGIWTGGEGSTFIDDAKKIEAFNIYNIGDKRYEDEVHKTLVNFLKKYGWYTESYDAGTFFFYPIVSKNESENQEEEKEEEYVSKWLMIPSKCTYKGETYRILSIDMQGGYFTLHTNEDGGKLLHDIDMDACEPISED